MSVGFANRRPSSQKAANGSRLTFALIPSDSDCDRTLRLFSRVLTRKQRADQNQERETELKAGLQVGAEDFLPDWSLVYCVRDGECQWIFAEGRRCYQPVLPWRIIGLEQWPAYESTIMATERRLIAVESCHFATALLAAVVGIVLFAGPVAADHGRKYQDEILPLLKQYCHKCHIHFKREGELDLAKIDSGFKALEARPKWERVLGRLEQKEMPPEGHDAPTDEQRAKIVDWIRNIPKNVDNCNQLASDDTQHFYQGYVMSRRLTRAEYNRAIRDLFGVDLKPADRFPSDGSGGEGFDTTGDTLFTSPILMEKYLAAAHEVIDRVLADAGQTEELAAAKKRILIASPTDGVSPREAAVKVLLPLLRRAYRRPIQDDDANALLALFEKAQAQNRSFEDSVRLMLKGMLVSPHFLTLAEPEPGPEQAVDVKQPTLGERLVKSLKVAILNEPKSRADGIYRLPPHPLAARVSSLVWSSIPDDELAKAADDGTLYDEAVMRAQIQRMLRDPKASALGEVWGLQWLGLTALGTAHRPDPQKFPEFDDKLAADMQAETAAYVAFLFQNDRSLMELIDSDYLFVNERLSKLYGMPDVEGESLRRVVTTDRNRGGVLTHASVLTATSYPLRTSPVLRGRWLLEELLGGRVPPPPPNVPALADDQSVEGLTLRQRLERHRTDPNCASCHDRMDPLGFALERFDNLGRWRNELAGQPIDAAGKLPSGETFDGPAELKEVLKKRSPELIKHAIRKLYGFGVGREVNKFDQCTLDRIYAKLEQNDFRAGLLVEEIALSFPFQHRYVKK